MTDDQYTQDRTALRLVTRLDLLEERASVQVTRESVGEVALRRVVREEEVLMPVTLSREFLELTVRPGGGQVLLDGEPLEAGRTYEVLLSEERAQIVKTVHATQQVEVFKRTRTEQFQRSVTLGREALEVTGRTDLVTERPVVSGIDTSGLLQEPDPT
ncbi:YsnF/AvaK domain-containing protein [Deinococcus sp. 14RED07]|uniref:YsnF/AvaK domain-containing protein n=1 Tax=unclassified Deinococcus TaxID=2623546 RepID=UPI001E44743B|nr:MULTISPECIES: YsnF/AvaK domain-containing protein [unclassified Deinococcus]MCD0156618.1 YsnF/AvaK domain-containing protein [Deinococcus sp. 6GRE01]MCD0175593.1 YsnF/AvaK domain-containing protein [Deinococcus sp. 14RED07]